MILVRETFTATLNTCIQVVTAVVEMLVVSHKQDKENEQTHH